MTDIEKLQQDGYLLIPNLIDESTCEKYKNLLENYYQKYAPHYVNANAGSAHGLENKSQEKVVYNLHNKDLEWFKLFEHPQILELMQALLSGGSYKDSEPFYLNNNSARCPLKGNLGQQLHLDSRLPGVNHCLVANVIWMLDDFTETNGATRVVPGSHKFNSFTEDGKVYDEEILVTGKKGSALIFNANLWHGGGGNYDGSSRWALALGYARWFIKPSFDYMKNTPKHIYDNLTDQQKRLIGFDSIPPTDEFTRVRRRSANPEVPSDYQLPNV